MDSLLAKLQTSFPDRKFETTLIVADDLLPRKHIVVDGNILKTSWNPEYIQDAMVLHDFIEDFEDAILKEVSRELGS